MAAVCTRQDRSNRAQCLVMHDSKLWSGLRQGRSVARRIFDEDQEPTGRRPSGVLEAKPTIACSSCAIRPLPIVTFEMIQRGIRTRDRFSGSGISDFAIEGPGVRVRIGRVCGSWRWGRVLSANGKCTVADPYIVDEEAGGERDIIPTVAPKTVCNGTQDEH